MLGVVALPGGLRFDGDRTEPVILLALVVLVAWRFRLAWWALIAWDVFGLAVLLAGAQFFVRVSTVAAAEAAVVAALELLSLALLWSPSLDRHVLSVPAAPPSARRSAA